MLHKTKEFINTHKIKIGLFLVLSVFISSVSFKKIFDKHTRKRREKIEYIVVHYTANLHPKASAEANARYLQRTRNAGCHYAIDDEEIVQCVPENRVAFAVGDRKWLGFIPKPWHKGKIFNENSLSFEMCLGGGRNDSLIIDETAQRVAWQLYDKNLYFGSIIKKEDGCNYIKKVPDLGRVVRHHDVTGKYCPKFYYNQEWNQKLEDAFFYKFKMKVKYYFELTATDKKIK